MWSVKQRYRLVAGILVIRVVLEAVVSVHDGALKLAAHREGVTHYGPLQNTHTHAGLECLYMSEISENKSAEFCISQQKISGTRSCDLRRPDWFHPTCGSFQMAIIFPTSWMRPTNWNQSVEGTHIILLWNRCICARSSASLHGYLCPGVLGGCPRPSGRRGRSWGSPRRDRTRPPAGLKPWWRPSSSSARACSHSTQRAAGEGEVGLINK